MSDLDKSGVKLLVELFRKHAPLPHMFPIVGVLSACMVGTYLANTKLFPPLENLLTEGKNIYALVLLGTVITLAILYVSSCYFELHWAKQHWKELIPTPDASNLLTPAFISGAMTYLCFLTPNIRMFAAMYVVYCLLDSLGGFLYLITINQSLEKAIGSSRQKRYKTADFEAVRTFYQERWWVKLSLSKFILAIAAVALAWTQADSRYAYILLSATIALNEVIVWSWRYALYKQHGFLRLRRPKELKGPG